MLTGIGIIIATIAAVFAVYFGTRRVLGADPAERTNDLAASVLFRISALHGLVLALVFASELVEYHSLQFESANEVNALSDVYYDAARYGDDARGIQEAVTRYLEIVPTDEWRSLGEDDALSPDAWVQWDAAYTIALDLAATSPRQMALRDNMLAKIHLIAENRDLREHHAKTALSSMFWVAALVGVLFISVGYYSFPPRRENLFLMGIFAGYTGLILLTIYAMSNPFSEPAALPPQLYLDLLTELEG